MNISVRMPQLCRQSHAQAEECHLLPHSDPVLHHLRDIRSLRQPSCEALLEFVNASTKMNPYLIPMRKVFTLPSSLQ